MFGPRVVTLSLKAFTLIEVLVVAAVIATLVAILLPSLAAARARSQATACLAQMSKIALATIMYAQDNRDFLPRSQHSCAAHQQRPWSQAILKHLGIRASSAKAANAQAAQMSARGLYRCPADRRSEGWSYGTNVYTELEPENDDYEGSPRTWHRIADIRRPVFTVQLGENRGNVDHFMAHFWVMQSDAEVDFLRHSPRSNYAFFDGHVQGEFFRNTFDPARKLDHWNPSRMQ